MRLALSASSLHQPTARGGLSAFEVPASLTLLATALAIAGLGELLLQRVVYRAGMHIPREGISVSVYQGLTTLGDLAFSVAAVLLVVVAASLTLYLLRHSGILFMGLALGAAMLATALVWPLGVSGAAPLGPLVVILASCWLAGQALSRPGPRWMNLGLAAACLAVGAGQYRIALSQLHLGADLVWLQLVLELAILAGAVCLALAARTGARPYSFVLSGLLILLAVAVYAREPSSTAIILFWGTGMTMSLPPVLYLLAFACASFAALTWLGLPNTRHLGVALILLVVAGAQPQVVHHNLTALVALTLMSLSAASTSGLSVSRIQVQQKEAASHGQ
jgi:hypothetical protein